MNSKITLFAVLLLFFFETIQAQELSVKGTEISSKKSVEFNPLSPAKAAFYSAILPG